MEPRNSPSDSDVAGLLTWIASQGAKAPALIRAWAELVAAPEPDTLRNGYLASFALERDARRAYILDELDKRGGNQSETARALGLSRQTVWRATQPK